MTVAYDSTIGVRLDWLAIVARSTGWPVIERADWWRKSNLHGGFIPPGPLGVMVHHSASPNTPSWAGDRVAAYATDQAPGCPEYNYVIARDGTIRVCIAGGGNHAGVGGPWLFSTGMCPPDGANNRTISVCVELDGISEVGTLDQYRACAALCTAIIRRLGLPPGDVIGQKEWVDPHHAGRKIDPWAPGIELGQGDSYGPKRPDIPDMNVFRGAVLTGYTVGGWPTHHYTDPPPPPDPPSEDEDPMHVLWQDGRYSNLFDLTAGTAIDGVTRDALKAANTAEHKVATLVIGQHDWTLAALVWRAWGIGGETPATVIAAATRAGFLVPLSPIIAPSQHGTKW